MASMTTVSYFCLQAAKWHVEAQAASEHVRAEEMYSPDGSLKLGVNWLSRGAMDPAEVLELAAAIERAARAVQSLPCNGARVVHS